MDSALQFIGKDISFQQFYSFPLFLHLYSHLFLSSLIISAVGGIKMQGIDVSEGNGDARCTQKKGELFAIACCLSVVKSLLLPFLKLEDAWIMRCLGSVMLWLALNNWWKGMIYLKVPCDSAADEPFFQHLSLIWVHSSALMSQRQAIFGQSLNVWWWSTILILLLVMNNGHHLKYVAKTSQHVLFLKAQWS